MRQKVLILTYYRYPNGDAGAVRQHSFAKLYQKCGFDTTVIGMGNCTNFLAQTYDGVEYVSFRSKKNAIANRIANVLFYKRRLKKYLKKQNNFDVIQIVEIPLPAFNFIKRYSKKHNIKLIHDSVEWYSPEQFKSGEKARVYRLKDNYNRKWIDTNFSVIAISTFLENHFLSRGINSVRIPVILDLDKAHNKDFSSNDKIVIVYAGSPGKKDYFLEFLDALLMLSPSERSRFEFRILGATFESLKESIEKDDDYFAPLEGVLKCYGRVSRDTVYEHLNEANFTILMRSSTLRYAKAGFPTKVPESLMKSTPVICNITSDLGLYLEDEKNAIIVPNCNAQDICNSLKKILEMTPEKLNEMCKFARETAEKYFDYQLYIEQLKKIIDFKRG